MNYATVCSGIDAPAVAWNPLGWRQEFCAEIEAFPCAVLKHHNPTVPNLGDMTKYAQWPIRKLDVLIGGTPCQSFSIAGLRKGLADPRGNLTLTFLGLVERFAPTWVVWENVPGVLSDDGGRTFGLFLGGLAQLGYGFAYGILDAQFFGVPQRRRRPIVVGHIGGQWQRAGAVLFDRESLCGNPPPRRKSRERIAPTISSRTKGGGGLGTDFELDGGLIASNLVANGDAHSGFRDGDGIIPINMQGATKCGSSSPNGLGIGKAGDPANTLGANDRHAVAIPEIAALQERDSKGADSNTKEGHLIPVVAFTQNQDGDILTGDICAAIGTNQNATGRNTGKVQVGMAVRRLTPRECERLQGFPDDYSRIPYRGKPADKCPDGPRYKALGNSMAVPKIHWIGKRIEAVNNLTTTTH